MSSGTSPHRGYIDPNWSNPNGPHDAHIIIYGYTPNFALTVLAIVLFGISAIVHILQVWRWRTWYFIPMAFGTVMEVVGYIFRMMSAKYDPYNITYFVVQYFFIVTAPVLFSASIYTILTILIRRTDSQFAPLPPKVILWIFITADVIATIVQIAGAALIGVRSSNGQDPTTANNILLGGLAFQVFTFLVFILLLGFFLWRARSALSSGQSERKSDVESSQPHRASSFVSKAFLTAFIIATLAVYMRTIFRLAETIKGDYGTTAKKVNESFYGVFEFAPVVVAVYLFNVWHPGRYLK